MSRMSTQVPDGFPEDDGSGWVVPLRTETFDVADGHVVLTGPFTSEDVQEMRRRVPDMTVQHRQGAGTISILILSPSP